MSQHCRKAEGGRIDRSRPVRFSFNGQALEGYAGDTLASALLANGIRVVGRGFKFHRPRGILSAGVEEPNALVGADWGSGMIPLVRATLMPLLDGLAAESQNCYPTVNFDVGRILDYTRPLWPAGFYNKMFKWPSWHAFEGFIRSTAGLGRLPDGEDPTQYRHANAHCDVLVVGAGPAGLKAASQAAAQGEDVLLVEQDGEAGGSLLYDSWEMDGKPSDQWLAETVAGLKDAENVRLMTRATVAGYYDHNVLTIHDRRSAFSRTPVEIFWRVRARRVVIASGAIEQPLMFDNNDRPGIMLAGAMQQYAARYGVLPARRVLAAVNNDLAYQSIFSLDNAGIDIAAVVDSRAEVEPALLSGAEQRGIEVFQNANVADTRGTRGLKTVLISGKAGKQSIDCDGLAVSGGFNPTVHLYSQAGGKLRYDDNLACFRPHECRQAVEVTGAANGDFVEPQCYNIGPRKPAPGRSRCQWVDLQHDVTVSDLELAVRENYTSVEHLKRYTTTGMSVDQGKTSNLNALSVLGQLTNREPGAVGTTTFRPQFMPVTLGAIGGNRRGDFYHPPRLLPAHQWHEDAGAVFDDYGSWRRPSYYKNGSLSRDECIRNEVMLTRNHVGLFDGSPLGKIDVRGPDAAELLHRIYVNTVHTLKPGKVRYGLMLNENGVVIDDGVFVRLAEDHFLVNTTAANADRIAAWLEEWHQCEWPDLDLVLTPVTSQWAVTTLAGPDARSVLSSLPGMIDLSSDLFPHMSYGSGILDGEVPFRIQRVSFTGEQSFEMSIPAGKAEYWFERLMTVGEESGIGCMGIEALLLLRMEKGYLHVGSDTDGTTNPFDIGFGRIVENKSADFVGARSLKRPEDQRSGRRHLIGFEADEEILAGAHFVTSGVDSRSEGFVTSACVSPTLGRPVGLGLLENGFQRKGETATVFDNGKTSQVRIVDPCFYDPEGDRLRG